MQIVTLSHSSLTLKYRDELTALPEAARLIKTTARTCNHIVFLAAVKSKPSKERLERDTVQKLCKLSEEKADVVQWISQTVV